MKDMKAHVILVSPKWLQTPTAGIEEKQTNNFCQSVQKRCSKMVKRKKTGNYKTIFVTSKDNKIKVYLENAPLFILLWKKRLYLNKRPCKGNNILLGTLFGTVGA